jgi:hypothetical protein
MKNQNVKITNAEDMRNIVLESFSLFLAGKVTIDEMKQVNNTSGKVFSSINSQLKYNSATEKKNTIIPFMEIPVK